MKDEMLKEVVAEAKRFLARVDALHACRKPLTAAEQEERDRRSAFWTLGRNPHDARGGCKESSAVRRASMDLTRALAKLRRGA